jgi:hypothetical protein
MGLLSDTRKCVSVWKTISLKDTGLDMQSVHHSH